MQAMSNVEERRAALVLVQRDGRVVGRLPALPVATPWWQETAPIIAAAQAQYGIEVTILRLLEAERESPPGGRVTYVAEVADDVAPPPVEAWHGTLDDHPERLSYARPGGPQADLAWADEVLARRGLKCRGAPEQIRSWNLSSLWRIPIEGGFAWLKVVPPFLAPEGALLEGLTGAPVPRLLGQDGHRLLTAEIPGADLYDAALPALLEMVGMLVELQQAWRGRVEALRALGLPDWRAAALAGEIARVFERNADALAEDARAVLARFIGDLPQRFARLADCGLPETLIHGDFHPGNFRGGDGDLVLLDWADAGIGHPLLDRPAFLSRIPREHVAEVEAHWAACWRRALSGCDPERAAMLIAPVAAARQAVVYQRFLDAIEPSEHPYHRGDPVAWLRRTAAILRRRD